ncbi:MAG: MFS transporter [Arachnia sp.]
MGELLRRYGPMVYLPSLVFAVGEGAMIPLIPVIATQRGADIPTAALVASALIVGSLCGNIPAGWLVGRLGERYTMVIAGSVALAGAVGCALLPGLAWLTGAVFVVGLAGAAFALARHAFMATRVPLAFRARALSLLGGSTRFGMFTGPFLAAALLALTGTAVSSLWFFAALMLGLVPLVLFGPDPEERARAEGAPLPDPTRRSRPECSGRCGAPGTCCCAWAPRACCWPRCGQRARSSCRCGVCPSGWTPRGSRSSSASRARSTSLCSTRAAR